MAGRSLSRRDWIARNIGGRFIETSALTGHHEGRLLRAGQGDLVHEWRATSVRENFIDEKGLDVHTLLDVTFPSRRKGLDGVLYFEFFYSQILTSLLFAFLLFALLFYFL